jgi:hypothetical protein
MGNGYDTSGDEYHLWYRATKIEPEFSAVPLGLGIPVYKENSGWVSMFAGAETINVLNDTEVSDIFGVWYIANTNYNEVNAKPLATITYNGQVIASLNAGETATLSCKDKKMASDVVVKVDEPTIPEGYVKPEGTLEITEHGTYDVKDYASVDVYGTYELKPLVVTENGVYENPDVDGYSKVTVNVTTPNPTPTEISTEAEMTALLETAEVGAVYKYVGETTELYENGAIYIVTEEVSE